MVAVSPTTRPELIFSRFHAASLDSGPNHLGPDARWFLAQNLGWRVNGANARDWPAKRSVRMTKGIVR